MKIDFQTVQNEKEVQQILALQALNHPTVLTAAVIQSQGFVTVRHDPDVLLRMNQKHPSVIAKVGPDLAGYCLVMLREFAHEVPELISMFTKLDTLSWKGKPLPDSAWFVMGQVCVAEKYRGQGVFDGMYNKLKEHCRADFDFVITEVAERNARSIRAHMRVGFETFHIYPDERTGEVWHVMALDL